MLNLDSGLLGTLFLISSPPGHRPEACGRIADLEGTRVL